jgi:protein SCO1
LKLYSIATYKCNIGDSFITITRVQRNQISLSALFIVKRCDVDTNSKSLQSISVAVGHDRPQRATAMLLSRIQIAAIVCGMLSALPGTATGSDRGQAPVERSELRALLWPGDETAARLDHRGRGLTEAALRDKVVVVAFVSADCAITCVVRTMELDRLARALPRALRGRVLVLGIDTDPVRDDGGRLRAFAEGLVGAATPLRLLVGDPAWTAALAARLRDPPTAPPGVPSGILLFDRRGQVAMAYGGETLDGSRLLRDVSALATFDQGLDRQPDGTDASAPL